MRLYSSDGSITIYIIIYYGDNSMIKRFIPPTIVMIVTIVILSLSSCGVKENISGTFQNGRTRLLDALTSEESEKINQMSNDIIECFDEKDKIAFKNLFCEQVRNKPYFDDEIDEAFKFLVCDVYSTSTIKDTASGGTSTEHGRRAEWYVVPEIPYFSVLAQNGSGTGASEPGLKSYYYSIDYYWQIAYEADSSLEGLHYMVIELLNVDRLIIGDRTPITQYNPYGYFD